LGVGRAKESLISYKTIGVKGMILHVKEAKYLYDYVIWLRFNDGAEGEVDLSLHKEELMRDWELAEQKKALFPIKPLE